MKKIRFLLLPFIIALTIFSCSKKEGPAPILPIVVPPPTSGGTSLAVVDNDIITFMGKYNVPGMSIAIVKDGKLVYAKGYGYADKENLIPVDTSSLFRLASLSKWFTSAAIMKLIQENKLTMNSKVFGMGGVLGTDFGSLPYPQYVTDITISNLLHHTGGGWGNASNDPMFQNREMPIKDHLSWVVYNVPLVNAPGSKLAYSNVGFAILCQVIEKVSGKSYQEYVHENIFKPAGIKNMQMGESTLAGRKPNEVKYYGLGSANPYGYGDIMIPKLSGAGGWIASTKDLMRFMVRVDGFPSVADILNASTLSLMSGKEPNSESYAAGFRISTTGNWFHGGTLTGTRNWMVKTTTGYSWAILINTSATNDAFNNDLDKLIWPAVNSSATQWPDADLFY